MSVETIRVIYFHPNLINKDWDYYQENKSKGNIVEFERLGNQKILLKETFYNKLEDFNLFSESFKSEHKYGDLTTFIDVKRDIVESSTIQNFLIEDTELKTIDEYEVLLKTKLDRRDSIFYFKKCVFSFKEPIEINSLVGIENLFWFDCKIHSLLFNTSEEYTRQKLLTLSFFSCTIDTLTSTSFGKKNIFSLNN